MMFGASLLGVTPGRPDRPMGRHVSPLTCHPQEDGPSQRPSSGKCSGVQPAREVVVATAVDAAAVVAAAADTLLLLHTTRYDATSSHHDLEAFFFPLLQEAVVAAAVTPLQSSLSRSMRCLGILSPYLGAFFFPFFATTHNSPFRLWYKAIASSM